MFTRDDLIDTIVRHLQFTQKADGRVLSLNSRKGPDPKREVVPSPDKRRSAAAPPGPKGRQFVTELAIKKMLTAGQTRLTLPADAIISPLAVDWLILKGITVVRQQP